MNVWNIDKEVYLDEFLDKMKKAGNIIGYFVLGARTEEERVKVLNKNREEILLVYWFIMKQKKTPQKLLEYSMTLSLANYG